MELLTVFIKYEILIYCYRICSGIWIVPATERGLHPGDSIISMFVISRFRSMHFIVTWSGWRIYTPYQPSSTPVLYVTERVCPHRFMAQVRTKTTEGHYSPEPLELARLVGSLFYGTRVMLVLNLPAFETKNTQFMTVSTETVRMAKSWTRENQSKRSDLPCHIVNMGYWPSVRSRWLDSGQIPFFVSLWTETESRSINSQKKERGQYQPSWPNKRGQ